MAGWLAEQCRLDEGWTRDWLQGFGERYPPVAAPRAQVPPALGLAVPVEGDCLGCLAESEPVPPVIVPEQLGFSVQPRAGGPPGPAAAPGAAESPGPAGEPLVLPQPPRPAAPAQAEFRVRGQDPGPGAAARPKARTVVALVVMGWRRVVESLPFVPALEEWAGAVVLGALCLPGAGRPRCRE